MPLSLLLNGLKITAIADSSRISEAGIVLQGQDITVALPPGVIRHYVHGWQSWSLTSWIDKDRTLPLPFPVAIRPMRIDPCFADHTHLHSSWVGAIEFIDQRILLLGALGLGGHIEYHPESIRGRYEDAPGEWLVAYGTEQEVFNSYSRALAAIFDTGPRSAAPRVWCSWYSYYAHIDQDSLAQDLVGLRGLPFDVFQIDDGWEVMVGDWEPNPHFSNGMQAMARIIRAEGLTPGLWVAPLVAPSTSRLFAEHPEWFLRDEQGRLVSAGHNWGSQLYALNSSLPAVVEWLTNLMKKFRGWGYDYIKLDFLYAGALPGKRSNELPREASLRETLRALRESLGDAYLLVCGVPILPAIGLCDGLRIGPDVGPGWSNTLFSEILYDFAMPGGQNALRTSLHRLWLRPLVNTDPDVALFRSVHNNWTPAQRDLFRDLALIAGFRGTSDLPRWLDSVERERLDSFLRASPAIVQMGRYRYQIDGQVVDFSSHVGLPPEAAMQTSPLKRFIQQSSGAGPVLRLAQRFEDQRQRRRLRK